MRIQRMDGLVGVCAVLAAGWPAAAPAADATTGIAAGLGLTAASGKTTMASGAGGIEATLLTSDAIMAAGREIRWRAAAVAAGQPLIVIGRSDTLDLASASWVKARMQTLLDEIKAVDLAHCSDKDPAAHGGGGGGGGVQRELAGVPLTGSPADITAALATDVSISPITVSVDDRLLINAVAAKAEPSGWVGLGARDAAVFVQDGSVIVPGEIVDVGSGNDLMRSYVALQQASDGLTKCTSGPAKAAVSNVTAFVKSMSTATKGQAPIMLAAELYTVEQKRPLILRVAIEQAGGSAITRSNIWYTLGWPGQATISSGLLASYRLTDPSSGEVKAQGLVRCMTKPRNFDKVAKSLGEAPRQVCQVAPS